MTPKTRKPKRSSQGPIVLWHGMNLRNMVGMLARRPPMHWSRAHRIALLPVLTAWNSAMSLLENVLYAKKVRQTEISKPPVFILGFWRSGTTLLHNLITRDPNFTYPNSYQVFFPTHFLATGKIVPKLTRSLLPNTRPMDNVKFGWDLPQEDEFALATMTMLSPYILPLFPDDYSVYQKTFDFAGVDSKLLNKWKNALDVLIRKVTIASEDDGKQKTVVLKSPGHTYRVPTLLEMYPKAKFIYIYRDPANVFNSSVHMRKTLVRENELGCSPLVGHEDEVIRTYKHAFECYERDRALIPQGNLHEIRFEDLEAKPLAELGHVYDGLNLDGFSKLRSILEPEIPAIKQYKKNRFEPDLALMMRVYEELKPAFDRFGYDSPLEAANRPAA